MSKRKIKSGLQVRTCRRNKMELKQLEFLVACIECGSYCKASEVLYTTQANISKVITKLEDELGYKLLERGRNGVRPTDDGKKLYNNAKAILEQAEHISSKKKFNADNYLNVVSVFDAEFLSCFNSFINDRSLGKSKIGFFMGDTEKIVDYVENGRAEIGFLYTDSLHINRLKYILEEKQLELKKIANAELFLSVGKSNSLFESEQITIDQLHGQEFVFFGNAPLFSKDYYTNRLIKKLNLEESIDRAISTNSETFLKYILEETERSYLHYSFMPHYYMYHTINNLQIEQTNNDANWCYIKKTGNELGSFNRDLVNYLSKALIT